MFYGATQEDAKYYDGQGEDGPLDLTPMLRNSKTIATTFITKVSVSVNSQTAEQNDGKFSFNGKFMENTYKVNDIVLTIKAYDGKPLSYYASNAGLTLDVDGDYYWATNTVTPSSNPAAPAIAVTGATLNSDGQYTIPELSFTVDGKYNCALTVILKDAEGNVIYTNENVKLPEVVVTWVAPTVTISETYNDAVKSNSFNAYNTSSQQVEVTNSTDGTTATVYTRTYSIGRLRQYYSSTVTITLDNSGYASKATLTFYQGESTTATNKLFSNIDTGGAADQTVDQYKTSAFTWGGSNTVLDGCDSGCKRYVGEFYEGYSVLIKVQQGTKSPAGTIKASKLVLTYGNVDYTFTIPTLTINNPY